MARSEVVPLSAGRPESQLFAADLRFLSSILTERRVDRCNARRASSVLRTFHVIELVKRHCGAPSVSAKELGTRACVTPNHLGKAFQDHVGLTLGDYLSTVRLSRGARLLRYSTMPVSAIAFESGYATASNFTRAYRGGFGQTPEDSRQIFRSRLENNTRNKLDLDEKVVTNR